MSPQVGVPTPCPMSHPSLHRDDDPQLREERGFVAWPSPGYVPAQAVWGRWSFSLQSVTRSIISDNAPSFSDATVTMFDHTGQIPTRIIARPYGRWLVWAVAGDTNSVVHPQPRSADRCYTVTIRGVWIGDNPQEPYQYVTCVLADTTDTPQWPRHVELTLATSGSAQSDRDALVSLYNSTNGPNWRSATNWNTDEPVDQWEGVTADPSGRVTSLTLQANSLSGPLPKEIGNLTGLSRLDLSHNRLTGPIPEEIGNLTGLRYLTLGSNQLSRPIPKEVGNLTGLRYLWLEINQLSGPIPKEVGNLTNLWFLRLWRNQLSGPIPKEIAKLTSLSELGLSDNQLSGPIPKEIGNMSNLHFLYLGGNQLTGLIPEEIGKLTSLSILTLDNNYLSGPIPVELGNLKGIGYIRLGGNQLTGCIPKNLAPRVRDLDLDPCQD